MIHLWEKDGRVIFHTDLDAAAELDGLTRPPDKTISEKEFEEAQGLLRLIGGKIIVGKTDQEIADEAVVEEAQKEMDAIKNEIAQRDYRALKAQKLGESIDELYPGETDWYKEQLARMETLEAILATHSAA
jgi:hypothetical protein